MSQPETSIFTKIINREIPAQIEYEDDEVIAIKDINAQAPVHFLVIPKEQIAKIGEITPEQEHLLPKMFRVAAELAKKSGIFEEGYRLVFNSGDNGGQTVYHIHLHVLGGRVMHWPPG